MPVSTMTSKGQVTIPKSIRDRLELQTGDRLDFRLEEDGTIRIYPIARKVVDVFGVLAEKAKGSYTTREIDERLAAALRKRRK